MMHLSSIANLTRPSCVTARLSENSTRHTVRVILWTYFDEGTLRPYDFPKITKTAALFYGQLLAP